MNRSLNLGAEKEKVGNLWQVTVLTCILVFIACLAFTATSAFADEGKAKASINWGSPNPNSLIPNPSLSEDPDQEISTDGSRVAMFRLYNRWTGEHFYTSSKSERDDIVKAGWVYEQIEWYAPTSEDFKPVYRLYNKYVEGGDHHYTTSSDEKDECVKAGWTYEGEGWRTVEEGAPEYVKVLRQYNPYAITGTHNYTTDEDEQKYLVSLGWRAEADGGWGGYKTLEPSTQAIDFTKAEVDTADKTYTSKAITPKATVTGLTAGTDYVVTYSNNVNAGTATIKIEGKGDYTGSKEWSFKINPLNISNASVTLGESLTYNAKEQTQTVSKVVASGITLSTTDFTLSDNKQTNAGTYTLKVSAASKNFTGTKQVIFTISKADPKYSIPQNLSATINTLLSAVELPEYDGSGTETAGKWVWDSQYDADQTVGGEAGTQTYVAKFMPTDTNNYNQPDAIGLEIEVVDYVKATFVANAPDGKTATVDGSTGQVVKTWNFDEGQSYHTIVATDFPTATIGDTTYFLAGWTTDASGTYGPTQLQMVGTTVNSHVTYYAVWRQPTSGYWLGSANATVDFDDEAYFATNDPNYHSASEIGEDMKVLHERSNDEYDTIKYKWDAFYDDADSAGSGVGNQVRLYATYEDGENEGSYDATSTDHNKGETSNLNKFVEFRILEVSGEGGHLNTSDDANSGDGSVVTFMATHVLPTAYAMRSDASNLGGWDPADLRKKLQSGGELYNKFPTSLTNAILIVSKLNNATRTSAGKTTNDAFWLPSYSELNAIGTYPDCAPIGEGTAYQWCKDKSIDGYAADNAALAYKTRAGMTPGSCDGDYCIWWERSLFVDDSSTHFMRVSSSGGASNGSKVNDRFGITPCFAF